MNQAMSTHRRCTPLLLTLATALVACGDHEQDVRAGTDATAPTKPLIASSRKPIAAPPAIRSKAQRAPTLPVDESIPPYVLELGANHATLCWLTEKELVGSVCLFSYSEKSDHQEDTAPSRYHRVAIKGLAPATTYRYEIGLNYRGSFRTADSSPTFEVAVFGHPGGTEAPLEYPTELLAGRLLDIDPEIVLCTGDIALSASPRSIRETFFNRFGRFMASKPIYVCPSNHEGKHNGRDYSEFRKLFPYEFGPATGGSHWFDYKNARFFALTYKLNTPELFREHVEWLCQAIDASDQEFNIVYLGGQEPKYYDKDFLFRSLSKRPVELVIGGDGGGVWQQQHHGIDFYFSGDGSMRQYPFYYLRFFEHHFNVQTQYTDGAGKNYRSFYSKRPRRIVQDLAAKQAETEPHIVHFKSLGIDTKIAGGVSFEIDWHFDEDVELEMTWASENRRGLAKVQSHLVRKNTKTTVLIHVPLTRPEDAAGEPYTLDQLVLTLAPHRPYFRKYPLQEVISNAALFAR
ncbi:MAG: hypothetical protein ACI89X_002625 [Planctomycetota bacterium]|jgi:hypothetical protein